MLTFIWFIFKFLLSLLLLLVAGSALFQAFQHDRFYEPSLYGFAGVLTLLAALPWVFSKETRSRAVGLVCLPLSGALAFMAHAVFAGEMQFPIACKGRRRATCHLLNLLHEVGGSISVSFVILGFSLIKI
jgi:hypothetical protein